MMGRKDFVRESCSARARAGRKEGRTVGSIRVAENHTGLLQLEDTPLC